MKKRKQRRLIPSIETIIEWIGSPSSLMIHTLIFIFSFLFGIFDIFSWNRILLVLTTVVSLEAIYLAIFIQMSVNQNTASLREVEEDIDEIQEDIEEIDEEMQEDDIEEEKDREAIAQLSQKVEDLLAKVEELKK
ncbi:hypothetical protein KTR10_01755 [Candidatus Kaiserbacteria bacterium]|nr:hypothetical protein [Candidatus Kaiserbacteria bacterium]